MDFLLNFFYEEITSGGSSPFSTHIHRHCLNTPWDNGVLGPQKHPFTTREFNILGIMKSVVTFTHMETFRRNSKLALKFN